MFASLQLAKLLAPIAVSLASLALSALPGRSAEEVLLQLGPGNRSVTVADLEEFLEDGTTNGLLKSLNSDQQEYLRLALTQSQEFDIIPLSQWFNTPMGERTLLFVGQLFQTAARLNGQQAIRAAIITSLADDGRISTLELIQNFPSRQLVVDISKGIDYGRQAIDDINTALALNNAVSQQSAADGKLDTSFDIESLPDLIDDGPYDVEMVELALDDASRQRTFPADLFLPRELNEFQEPIPLVVLSHGLGDSRTNFHDFGRHLASHGIATVLPEHIGSNTEQKEAMLGGFSKETFFASEFLDRPLDISFVLDELERINESDFQGKLELDRVAVAGHSFGGYTVLAVAGATIDFEDLRQRCSPDANLLVNTARLLECRALELTGDSEIVEQLGERGVGDERVAAVMGFAPVSKLFGETGIGRIEVPVMLVSAAYDVVSPALQQQVAAFNWLQTPDKYFYLAEQGSHSRDSTRMTSLVLNLAKEFDRAILDSGTITDFTTLDLDLSEEFAQQIDEAIQVLRGVNSSIIVGFTRVHISEQAEYEPFLTANYVEVVSQEPFIMNLVRELPEGAVEALLAAPQER